MSNTVLFVGYMKFYESIDNLLIHLDMSLEDVQIIISLFIIFASQVQITLVGVCPICSITKGGRGNALW